MKEWKYAVSSADEAPDTAPILLKGSILDNLREAARLGYDAIEVHLRETEELDYDAINRTMEETGVRISMIVTGRLNTEGKCNLMDEVPYVAAAAVEGMKLYIDMASRLEAGIVIGWVKGNVPPGKNRDKYMARLARNLRILAEYAQERDVRLNLEVINRYEVNVFTTAQETMEFLDRNGIKNCYLHLDTFHMGIDETNPVETIRACKGRIGYMHFADNSRKYPGSGMIDFGRILEALDEVGYEGYLAVECLPWPDSETAAVRGLEHLKAKEPREMKMASSS
ncbi:sugar phosphate isomerase/epimerase family protein [Anaerotalea alkaliphila]|uniref:Sugar phosphate isomerase/epimerase n=1 Tax=Anaerotalea alkaliphila TaxID=2662126 RepID=A0A7X5HXF1_9FIRM|nr:sugar phosphate isomerase/epimerase family protein [Anaerotalea alkaliphila]NDL68376.1 sugar phosphate isomerase/epimerase [Anaerotalea alkaliphila]